MKRRIHNLAQAIPVNAELRRSMQQCKSQMSRDYLHNLVGAEVCRVARYANPQAVVTVKVITEKEDKQANSILEKELMLRCESFPPNN